MAILEAQQPGASEAGGASAVPNYEVDPSVLKEFPTGAKVLECKRYSTAAWTTAMRIVIELADGSKKSYFLKCAAGEIGRAMITAEFQSLEALYFYMPAMIPRPIAWGQLAHPGPMATNPPITSTTTVTAVSSNSGSDSYFLLLEFVELCMDMVDPVEFTEQVATLHRTSASPTGKFGFHIDTFQGPSRQICDWEADWSVYFTRLLDGFFAGDIAINGPDADYQAAYEQLKTLVVPALLQPLQAEGRTIKPCLIHGDLWEENTGTDLATGRTVMFDACAYYAHNEMELGMWRREVIKFGKAYFRQYLKNMPPSEPVEQWDDRNRLYSLKYNLSHSMAWPASSDATRELIMRDMRFLIDKYLAPSGSQS